MNGYTLNTIEDFENLKKEIGNRTNPIVQVGVLNNAPTKSILDSGDVEKTDPDGEKLDLRELNLTLVGAINDEPPLYKTQDLQTFSVAVARAGTYNQRHLPLWKKIVLLWYFFRELFLNRPYIADSTDPYVVAAHSWYRKQQTPPAFKMRMKLWFKRVRDLFVHNPNAENLDTFGMRGFETRRFTTQI